YVPTCSPTKANSDWYMEYKYLQNESMLKAVENIKEVCKTFKEQFGRFHGELLEEYRCHNADVVIMSMGSFAAQVKDVVDEMRDEGYQVGAVKLRTLRPFPINDIRRMAKQVKAIAVVDRGLSFGHCGQAFMEVKSALYHSSNKPLVKGYLLGLGGRDIKKTDQRHIIEQSFRDLEKGFVEKESEWVNLKSQV
ncbi:MAG: pyruvate ferredoxin oxidoreductase, partial [Candidatus Bathyarchaeota archaeon]